MVKSTRTIEANNSNAQFSTGPIDTSSSRLNALAHGILSGQENTDEFEELKSAMTTTIAPIGALEELLVDQLVTLSWRWRRVIKYETAAIRSKSHKAIERRLSHQDLFNNPQNLTDEAELLVLQRQFREGCGVMPAWRRGAWHGSVWPVRYCPAYPQATAATRLARTVPGAAFPAPPGRPAAS